MADPLVETWEISARINLYVLESLPPAALSAVASSKGRTVGEAFAHIHNVRLMWLKAAAPELLAGLDKIEKDGVAGPAIAKALKGSQAAVSALVTRALAAGGKVKGFKPHVHAFVGYLVAHEAHHRGQIALALKQSGIPLDKKVAYGIWEWGSR
jgi:uncharacterized damage-inducible protein DinB